MEEQNDQDVQQQKKLDEIKFSSPIAAESIETEKHESENESSDDDDDDNGFEDEDDDEEENEEADKLISMLGKIVLYFYTLNWSIFNIQCLGKRTSSGSQDDDGDDNDEDDMPKFVRDDLTAIETSNIIPRTKRRAALASGLITKNSSVRSSNSIVSTSKIYDSDD
jgi:hypothetical protein